jgi:hypothetical protein
LGCSVSNDPLITKQFWGLLAEGVAGQRGKSHALIIVISQIGAILQRLSILQGVGIENMGP